LANEEPTKGRVGPEILALKQAWTGWRN